MTERYSVRINLRHGTVVVRGDFASADKAIEYAKEVAKDGPGSVAVWEDLKNEEVENVDWE